jgi:hypothetical protein
MLFICQMIISVLWFVYWFINVRIPASCLTNGCQRRPSLSAPKFWRSTDLTRLWCTACFVLQWYVPLSYMHSCSCAEAKIGSRLQLRLADSLRCVLPVYTDCLPWPPPRGSSVTDGACNHFQPRVEKSSRLLLHGVFGRLVRNRDPVMLATAPPE